MVKYTAKDGREYTLRFDLSAMKAMNEKYGDYSKGFKELYRGDVDSVRDIFVILATAGEEYMAEEQGMKSIVQITGEGIISDHMSIGKLKGVMKAIDEAVKDGNRTMYADEEDNGVRDGYLEELKAAEAEKN